VNHRFARLSTALSATVGLALVAGLLGLPAAQAAEPVTAPAVQPAAPTLQTKTATLEQLLDNAAVVKPITIGYRASKFITPAQRAKKDKFGCNLNKQLLIKAASVKPRVAKGCKITGGVWMANGGTTRITDSRKVALAPMISFKQAWGLGAYAWTPAQRYAWATNVIAPPRTRAVGVTPLQATNQIYVASDLKQIIRTTSYVDNDLSKILTGDGSGPENFGRILAFIFTSGLSSGITLWKWTSSIENRKVCTNVTAAIAAILTNTAGWNLGIDPETRQRLEFGIEDCDATRLVNWTYAAYGALNKIPSVPSPIVVPNQGKPGSSPIGLKIYNDYGTPATAPVQPSLFGLHAPPDTGSAPTVPYGYLRLWDSAVSWADLNPSKGVYNWTKLQEALASPIAQGREVMYVLGNTPAWAGDGSPSSAPKNMNDVYDFVKALCGQGGGRITTYEAWNEGNLQTFWTGTQAELAQVTQQVRRALTDCPSGGNVVAASTGTRAEGAFVNNYTEYLKELAKLGWPIDGYAVHSYPSATGGPTERLDGVTQYKTMLAVNGAPVKPIYDSEVNYGLAGLGQNHIDIDAQTSSAYISRTFIDSVRYGIDYVFWFLWTPAYYNKLGVQLNSTTGVENRAWAITFDWLVGSRMQRCSDASPESDRSIIVTECQLTKGDGQLITLAWTNGKSAVIDTTGLGTVVQDLTGAGATIVNNSVTVGPKPIAIR
jgi:hypothetical protein